MIYYSTVKRIPCNTEHRGYRCSPNKTDSNTLTVMEQEQFTLLIEMLDRCIAGSHFITAVVSRRQMVKDMTVYEQPARHHPTVCKQDDLNLAAVQHFLPVLVPGVI